MDLSNFIILYVDNVQRSVDFYRPLFDREPVESMDGFAMFVSETGNKFALWAKSNVIPKVDDVKAGAMEVAFTVDGISTLSVHYAKWRELGVQIIQEPAELDFGTTFTVLDPDGHRLRVFCNEKS